MCHTEGPDCQYLNGNIFMGRLQFVNQSKALNVIVFSFDTLQFNQTGPARFCVKRLSPHACGSIFAKILRALGHHPLLSSSASASTHAFKPLQVVELPETDSSATVDIGAVRDSGDDVVSEERLQKLTVCYFFLRKKILDFVLR